MWVVMVQHKTSDQYLTSGKVSTRSIHRFKKYRLLKTLTQNFNILSNTGADKDANADAVVTEKEHSAVEVQWNTNNFLAYTIDTCVCMSFALFWASEKLSTGN